MTAVLVGAGIAMLASLLGTPLFIRFLVRRNYGQFIRQDCQQSIIAARDGLRTDRICFTRPMARSGWCRPLAGNRVPS